MTEIIGNLSLGLAVLLAAGAFVGALAAGKFESPQLLRLTRRLIGGVAALLTAASGALIAALLNNEFSNAYVASYTERALPFGYKLAAFWAGQEGSLLLWAWLLAVMAVIFAIVRRRDTGLFAAGALAPVAAILLFFSMLMLFAANPFRPAEVVPADGHGLNPMLQDPAMIAHPPMLFLGYAGYAFPFALMIGALVAGRKDNDWLAALRPWAIVSWLFLSIGILLGAQWAYVELGWGGYWAWDPVENASLLPWLTGTALLHSIMVQQHRGMFRKWNAFLIAVTFVLCVFGSYLTRSGVIQSVHAFGQSIIGTFFLAFLAVLAIVSAAVIAWRWPLLKPDRGLEGLVGREGFFLATNVLLLGMTLITLIGTIFPIISRVIASQEVTVGPPFYNKVVAPLGLLLVGLMAVGPLLSYGADAAKKLAKSIVIPAILAGLVVTGLWVWQGVHNGWALLAGAIATLGIAAVLIDLFKGLRRRVSETGEKPAVALVKLIDSTHRRYGGQTVHIGILMIALGVIGSSLFAVSDTPQLRPGESATVGGQKITFVKLDEKRFANYTAVEAEVILTTPAGKTSTLRPQRRFYDKSEQPNSEVAIESQLRRDVYVNLAGWEGGGAVTAIQVIVNPLVSLLWTGGLVLSIGGVFCLLPRFFRDATPAVARVEIKPVEIGRKRAVASVSHSF